MEILTIIEIFLLMPAMTEGVMHISVHPIGGTYNLGDDVTLQCSVAEKTGTCVWYKDNVDISYDTTMSGNSNPRQSVSSPVPNQDYFLTITGVTYDDAGDYSCVLTTGPLSSNTATLVIVAPPQSFGTQPDNATTIEGNTTNLECSVDNKDGTLHWEKDGISLNNDETVLINAGRYNILANAPIGEYNLQLSPTLVEDDGTFVCKVDGADNSQQIISEPATLSVIPLQKFEIEPTNQNATQHDSVLLPCDVIDKHGDVKWFKDDVIISSNYGIDATKCDTTRYSVVGVVANDEYNLQIVDAQISDSATYRCEVTATQQIPSIRSSDSQLIVTDFDECATDNICDDGYLCVNNEGSYQCICLAPQGCDTDDPCLVDVGFYRCQCAGTTNASNAEYGGVLMFPVNVTNGPYAIEISDNRSVCNCYRCVMDINVTTGQDLLHCHMLENTIFRGCPIVSIHSDWHAKFSEVAVLTLKPLNDDVVQDTFNTVFGVAVNAIIDGFTQELDTCSKDDCTNITGQIDDLAIDLVKELLDKYTPNHDIILKFDDEMTGIDVEARSVSRDKSEEISFPAKPTNFSAVITLPSSIMTSAGNTIIVNTLYRKPELVVASANVSANPGSVNSAIISSTIWPPLTEPLPVDSPVNITFKHRYPILTAAPTCGFLDDIDINRSGMTWSSEGCHVHDTNDDITICFCNHLTSFAVLMRVSDFDVDVVHEKALEIISLIGCGISLVSLTLTITTFCVIRHFTQERIIHINLCLSIGMGQVIFLAGIAATKNKVACTLVAVLLHYFFTSVFCWMLVEGIQLYAKLVRVFDNNPTKRFIAYFLTGWGVPMVIVVISVAADHMHYGSESNCWLSVDSGLIWAFVGPALLVIMTNVVFLGMVVRVIAKLQNCAEDDKHTKIRASLKAAIVLLPLLGMTWLFGLLSVNQHTIFFEYVFAILNSLQGFFIFIFYCVNSSEVRAQIARKKQTIELTHGLSFTGVTPTTGYTSNRVRPSTSSEEMTRTNIASRSSIRISLDNGIQEEDINDDNLM